VPSQIRRNAASKYVEAITAFIRGVRKAPNFKGAHANRICVVTKELFNATMDEYFTRLCFKKTEKSRPFCTLKVPNKPGQMSVPSMVTISRQGKRFWISFSFDTAIVLRSPKEILAIFQSYPAAQQEALVLGMDVGVVKPVALSNGVDFDFTPEEKKALEKNERSRLKYQVKMARQREHAKKHPGARSSNQYKKIQAKVAARYAYNTNLRKNMAHRTSKEIAESEAMVVIAEDLQIKNLTKRPQAKQDPVTQKWLPNGARAKAGLNKAILHVAWGRMILYVEYKLQERGKLLIKRPAAYSSQDCVICDHRDAGNRKTQSEFCCLQCGHAENADTHAAQVLKKRWIRDLHTGTFSFKEKTAKKITRRKLAAARIAVSVCGAEVKPDSSGAGYEAEISMAQAH